MDSDYLKDFINYIKSQKRYSERTAVLYEDAVGRFYKCITPLENDKLIDILTPQNIRIFVMENLKNGLSAGSVNNMLSALSSYCRYLTRHGILEENPVNKVYRPKEKKRLPEFYDKEKLGEYIYNSMERDSGNANHENGDKSYSQIRNRLIVTLLYATGMRRAEITNLTLGEYDRSRGVFRITGKGAKVREIPVIPFLFKEIDVY